MSAVVRFIVGYLSVSFDFCWPVIHDDWEIPLKLWLMFSLSWQGYYVELFFAAGRTCVCLSLSVGMGAMFALWRLHE